MRLAEPGITASWPAGPIRSVVAAVDPGSPKREWVADQPQLPALQTTSSGNSIATNSKQSQHTFFDSLESIADKASRTKQSTFSSGSVFHLFLVCVAVPGLLLQHGIPNDPQGNEGHPGKSQLSPVCSLYAQADTNKQS